MHDFPGSGFDDWLMVSGHIILGYFAFVDFHGFGQEIGDEALLQQLVTLVFLVGQNRANVG